MVLSSERERTRAACRLVRNELLAERKPQGCWTGSLSSSPLATATAISALMLAEHGDSNIGLPAYNPDEIRVDPDELYQSDLSELIVHSLHWLAEHQNDDGGWGDTDRSQSNLATTLLVNAAFHLSGVPAKYNKLIERTEEYIRKQGGIAALKERCKKDRTLVVPVLMNYALADLLPWRKVPALPFELASLPAQWRRRLGLPMLTYALPALAAIGLARFYHAPPRNPLSRWFRARKRDKCLALIEELQPRNGGFLEATPLTSFVVMSLSSMGLDDHRVVRRGVEFLLTTVRADGSWPIESNLATWNTSHALEALDWQLDADSDALARQPSSEAIRSLEWLLACQHDQRHPWTGAAPGGWAWTDHPGGIPNADDTAAALTALAGWRRHWPDERDQEVKRAARAGVCWLLDLENDDGGWPTFARGRGRSPWDQASPDVTANVMRALGAWRELLGFENPDAPLARRIDQALEKGLRYLTRAQQSDGSWSALWFGNQLHVEGANLVYGTSKVLAMLHELGWHHTELAQRGVNWLTKVQLAGGAWGAVSGTTANLSMTNSTVLETAASVEETALAVEALLPYGLTDENVAVAVQQGVSWLAEAVLEGRHNEPAPLGFYFARIWYYERLYPLVFAARALASASSTVHGSLLQTSPQIPLAESHISP